MAIFGLIDSDSVVQVDDKLRLSAKQSYTSKEEADVTLVEIEPAAGAGFIDVTASNSDDWFLDWQYATDGVSVVSLRITTDGAPVTVTKNITVVTAAEDALFSDDEGILSHETEMLDLLPDGRSSWKFVHRKAQQLIMDWFSEQGWQAYSGNRINKDMFKDLEEVRKWSESWTLSLIFKDMSNSIADKFDQKSVVYASLALDARRRAVFKLDLDEDGTINDGEHINISSVRMSRR